MFVVVINLVNFLGHADADQTGDGGCLRGAGEPAARLRFSCFRSLPCPLHGQRRTAPVS